MKKKIINSFVKSTKNFWENFSINDFSPSSKMNLEPNEKKSIQKRKIEKKHILKIVKFNKKKDILLDYGAGFGIWSRFLSLKVKLVIAIEPVGAFIEFFKKNNHRKNIIIIKGKIRQIPKNITFTKIFFSGVTIYLNDLELHKLLKQIYKSLDKNGIIIHRDSYATQKKLTLIRKYGERLQSYYTAIYRTNSQYDKIMNKNGFKLIYFKDIYGSKSKMNIWKETRLGIRIYKKVCNL